MFPNTGNAFLQAPVDSVPGQGTGAPSQQQDMVQGVQPAAPQQAAPTPLTSGSMTGQSALDQGQAQFQLGDLRIQGLPAQVVQDLNAEIQKNISNLQSRYDRNVAEMTRQMQEYTRGLEEQVFQLQLQGRSEEEQVALWQQRHNATLSEREQSIAQREQQIQQVQRYEAQLAGLSQKSGLPVEQLRELSKQMGPTELAYFAAQQQAARQYMPNVPPSQYVNPTPMNQGQSLRGATPQPGSPQWHQMWEDMKNGKYG